jgi:hypothetical protein
MVIEMERGGHAPPGAGRALFWNFNTSFSFYLSLISSSILLKSIVAGSDAMVDIKGAETASFGSKTS